MWMSVAGLESASNANTFNIARHTITDISPFRPSDLRFARVHIDRVRPLPTSRGARYLLTYVDRFTRWPEAFPVSDMTPETVAANFIDGWMTCLGCLEVVRTKKGRQFKSTLFTAFVAILGVRHIQATTNRTSTNGMGDRRHHYVKAAFATHKLR